MQLNVSNVYNELINLSSLINSLEKEYLNIYQLLSEVANYWKDNNSINYLNHLQKEKIKTKNICDELTNIKDVYSYFIEQYSKIGNKIFFNEKNVSKVLTKFDDYINHGENILKKYNELNLSSYDYGFDLLDEQINTLKSNLKKSMQIKAVMKKIFDDIVSIENTIKEKISKIDLEIIKESDINEFL